MKAVTIVCPSGRKTVMTAALRECGVVHIKSLKRNCPGSDELEKKLSSMARVVSAINEKAGKAAKDVEQESLLDSEFTAVHAKLEAALAAISSATAEEKEAETEAKRIEGWGEFDPEAVKALEKDFGPLSFWTLDAKSLRKLDESRDLSYVRLKDVNGQAAICVVSGELPPNTGARRFELPSEPLSSLEERIATARDRRDKAERTLASAAKWLGAYSKAAAALREQALFERVKATATEELDGQVTLLSGYVPESLVDNIKECAAENRWAWLLTDIADDDNPPTRLRYKGIVRIMQPLYDILGTVPGYRERDISSWFLAFFALFFAMIIGDAGYGIIFIIIGVVMQKKAGKCSDMNILVYVIGGATVIWGALTGTWFGSLEFVEALPFLKVFIIPQIANYSEELFGISSSDSQNAMMKLCFFLGCIQLSLACVLNVIDKAKKKDISLVSDIGWLLCIIMMYFLSLVLVIGESVPLAPIGIGVGTGFVLVLLFGAQGPGVKFSTGVLRGLADFLTVFLNTVSCFSNIMSYIRLFAVGMASLAIAQSFNDMGGMMLSGWAFPLGCLVIVIGHAMNLVMGLLSVVVHGVRLNLLEFSGQLGMEWNGYKYEPFKRTAAVGDGK